ncbi:MAG: ATP-binding cassette domain-containing protein [Burkholderiales bacterium]|nr:ATP-binding cassette domain-containing protein [Burkholderiales bacterium]
MLELTQLRLDRDGRTVLNGITVQAQVGQITALLGPNGAGKSSLLSVAAGELVATSGQCTFDGLNMAGQHPRHAARRRAMLPQQSALDFDFTVDDVVALGASPFPEIPTEGLDGLCKSVMRLTDTDALIGRRYPALSGGERQRVQIARVLVQACAAAALGPALLLLDEPTASLDPRHQHVLLAGLRELCRNVPLAIVASLHEVNHAVAYADHCWLIKSGELVATGAPEMALGLDVLSAAFEIPVHRAGQYFIFALPAGESPR